MKKIYAGITIGPIIETMSLTSTPAGLWFSSFFFSTITRDICIELKDRKYNILTLPENHEFQKNTGIGKYHDRIYFTAESGSKEDIKKEILEILDCIKGNKAKEIDGILQKNSKSDIKSDIKSFLDEFLNLHFVIQEMEDGDGIAKKLSDALDALELFDQIPSYSRNYIKELLSGEEESKNNYIKKYLKTINPQDLTLYENEQIKSLENITKISSNKAKSYYAIVQADGDNMGIVINNAKQDYMKSLELQEKRIRKFSELCFEYTSKASQLINAYGGVVIYAGGDDLLFIAPVQGKNQNIWQLCKSIENEFRKIFNETVTFVEGRKLLDDEKKPSLSFGVSINYNKFPLYEAFEDSRSLLFYHAKNFGKKNNVAIKLHKHSGQTSGFICCLNTSDQEKSLYDEFIQIIELFENKNSNLNEKIATSVLYHTEELKELLNIAIEDKDDIRIENAYRGLFDNSTQENYQDLITEIIALAKLIRRNEGSVKSLDNEKSKVNIISNMLRIAKFLVESDGGKNNG